MVNPLKKDFKIQKEKCEELSEKLSKLNWQGKASNHEVRQQERHCYEELTKKRLELFNTKITLVKKFGKKEEQKSYVDRLIWWNNYRGFKMVVRKYHRLLRREWRNTTPDLLKVSEFRAKEKLYTELMTQKRLELAKNARNAH